MIELNSVGIDFFLDKTAVIKRPHLVGVGNHVAIDVGVYISTMATIGDYVHIAPYTCVIGGELSNLIMGHFSGISAGSKIVCGSDDYTRGMMNPQVPDEFKYTKYTTIKCGDFSCVVVNCVVMPGVVLAEGSVVGSGSVLTKDTDPWTIYVGSPAKAVKIRDRDSVIGFARKLGYNY